mgnify:CR=1 FL=1
MASRASPTPHSADTHARPHDRCRALAVDEDETGAALAGPEGLPTTDVDGPAVAAPKIEEPTSPKVGATMDGSAHSFQGAPMCERCQSITTTSCLSKNLRSASSHSPT